jgi:hypothetical protein
MSKATTQITIARTLPSDIGLRDVHLYLDGTRIATLKYTESITVVVTPGQHSIRADNTFANKTLTFDVQPGDHVHVATANRSGCATALIYILGAGPIYLSLEQVDNSTAETAPSQ